MKNLTLIRLGLVLMLGIGLSLNNKVEATPSPMGVSFQVFYNELSPYGDWVNDRNHGYVWIPNVGGNFHPYGTNGYWEMTNFGNTWVSHYDWGWAPFHYGRWFWTDFYGWAWVPGYEWGPAWVNWRTGGGYYGWAPLGPGVGINVSIGFHSNHWRFVPQRRFRHRHFYNYYVPSRNVVSIYNRTTIINNTYVYNNRTYVSGPARRDVERVTRTAVPVYQVNNSPRPGRSSVGNNRTLNVYRPEIDNSRTANAQARPSRALTADEYRSTRSANQSRSTVTTNSRGTSNRDANTRVNSQSRTTTQESRAGSSSRTQTAPRNTRESSVQNSTRPSEVRPSAPQQRQSSPRVNQNNRSSSPREATAPASNRSSKRENVRQSAPNTRNTGTVNSAPARQTKAAPARSNTPSNVRQTAPNTRSSNTVNSAPSRNSNASPSRSNSRSSSSTSRGGRGN